MEPREALSKQPLVSGAGSSFSTERVEARAEPGAKSGADRADDTHTSPRQPSTNPLRCAVPPNVLIIAVLAAWAELWEFPV